MDHVVYVDAKEKELKKLLSGSKRIIIRGATGRKLPHGRVQTGDRLFFIENDGSGLVQAQAEVASAFSSEKLSEAESQKMVEDNQARLQLSAAQIKRWAGKRYLVLVEVCAVQTVTPFNIDRSEYGNMDDWLPVGEIERVRMPASDSSSA